jgi:thiamine biosynthesis protein ThiS
LNIRLNGDPYEIAGPRTVLQLLEDLKIDPRRVAVEHNLAIIKRPQYATAMIGEGDTIEIVNFVGGGWKP